MDKLDFLTRKETAELLGVKISVLNIWAHRKKHLAYIKIGRSTRYYKPDIEAFVKSRIIGDSLLNRDTVNA